MPTEAEQTSVTPIYTHSRDTSMHLGSDSGFEVTDLKVNKALLDHSLSLPRSQGTYIHHSEGHQNCQC